MDANVKGRVANISLPASAALLPLFEAIINSIDAIEDAGRGREHGRIEIIVHRQPSLKLAVDGTPDLRVRRTIQDFTIIDNGIGFTDQHFRAFNEADTQFKAGRGGKGVGRFGWLKAFERAEVDSVYEESQQHWHRHFSFSTAYKNGVRGGKQPNTVGDDKSVATSIRLVGFKDYYEREVASAPGTIAARIVEHCLAYFVYNRMPDSVILRDRDGADEVLVDLWSTFDSLVDRKEYKEGTRIIVEGEPLELAHFLVHATSHMRHQINYCANQRVVKTDVLTNSSKVPNLPATVLSQHGDDAEPMVYVCYVSGQTLDINVNAQRTDFNSAPEGGLPIPGYLRWHQIQDAILDAVRAHLLPYTQSTKEEKLAEIRAYAYSEAPEYRILVEHYADKLDQVAPGLPKQQLDIELHKLKREVEGEIDERGQQIFQTAERSTDPQTIDDAVGSFPDWWKLVTELGKTSLAQYTLRRRRMLNYLDKALELGATGKYPRERVFHDVIFPLRSTSDDVSYEEHNLWVLDEKLAYHWYLASDKPIRDLRHVDSGEADRPDIAVFYDRPIAVVDSEDPYKSVEVFEFKRPMRDDYDPDDNPIDQVLSYVRKLRAGLVVKANGRPIPPLEDIPFYCHIVADLRPSLREMALMHGLYQTPDKGGFYGYNPGYRAYIEITSFDRLISDANKRNRIFFRMLQIPDAIK